MRVQKVGCGHRRSMQSPGASTQHAQMLTWQRREAGRGGQRACNTQRCRRKGGHTGGMGMAQKRARNDSKQKENNRNKKKGTYTRRCGQVVVVLFCHGDNQVSPRRSNGLSRILSQTHQFIKDIAHLWVSGQFCYPRQSCCRV